jgi:sulfate permease, SulP family
MASDQQELRLSFHWLDLLCGLSVAGFILPEAVAYAGIANMPPLAGIIGACVGLIVYGILGTSRFAIVAATSSSAAVLAAAVRSLQPIDVQYSASLGAAIVLITGVIFCWFCVLRLGRIAQFIARPVVRGLAFGLAIVIVLRQFAKVTGIHVDNPNTIPLAYDLLRHVQQWNFYAMACWLSALLLLVVFKRWPRVPGPLLAITLGIAAGKWLDLSGWGIAVVGHIALGGIDVSIPRLSADAWSRVAELSVALALILFAESYSSVRTVALKHGDRVDVNRDLLALGVANLISGILHAMPVGAGYSATMANESVGTRSRMAGLATALYILIAIVLLIKYVELIPEPVLAAIIAFAMQHALALAPLRPYMQWKRDRLIVVASIVAVLLFGVLDGLLAAVALSLVVFIRGLSQPRVSVLGRLGVSHDYVVIGVHPDAIALPGLLIVRPEEPLFFGNVDAVLENVWLLLEKTRDVHTIILSLEESPDVDGTTIEALQQFITQIRNRNLQVILARVKDRVLRVLTIARLEGLDVAYISTSSIAATIESLVPGKATLQIS